MHREVAASSGISSVLQRNGLKILTGPGAALQWIFEGARLVWHIPPQVGAPVIEMDAIAARCYPGGNVPRQSGVLCFTAVGAIMFIEEHPDAYECKLMPPTH